MLISNAELFSINGGCNEIECQKICNVCTNDKYCNWLNIVKNNEKIRINYHRS